MIRRIALPSIVLLLLASAGSADSLPNGFAEYRSAHYNLRTDVHETRARQALDAAERLHRAWERWTGSPSHHGPHRLRLFSSREGMRQALPGMGWAEAIYHDSICDQYDDRFEERPWHWLTHEATHQLAYEDSRLELNRWANEGLACLFSTSRVVDGRIVLGSVDKETYPVWWLVKTPLRRDFDKDSRSLLVRPSVFLREFDFARIDRTVNQHYLSWWSFAHYLYTTDSVGWKEWVAKDGTREGLDRRFGSGPELDKKWYAHILGLADSVLPKPVATPPRKAPASKPP